MTLDGSKSLGLRLIHGGLLLFVLTSCSAFRWERVAFDRHENGAESLKKMKEFTSSEDFDRVRSAWENNVAFLWSGTKMAKDPEKLEMLLRTVFQPKIETSTVESLDLELNKSLTSTIRLKSLHLVMASNSSYEKEKLLGNKELDSKALNENLHSWESVGYAILTDLNGRYCSLPVTGQSLEEVHFVFLDSKDESTGYRLSGAGESLLKISNSLTPIEVVADKSFEALCTWKAIESESQVFPIEREALAPKIYSVFDFFGVSMSNPMNSSEVVTLVLQLPSIRRGVSAGCALPEEKRWFFIGTKEVRNKASYLSLKGGRYYIERDASSLIRKEAIAGASLKWSDVIDAHGDDFVMYLMSNKANPLTLGLHSLPTSTTVEEKLNLLLKEIPRGPF